MIKKLVKAWHKYWYRRHWSVAMYLGNAHNWEMELGTKVRTEWQRRIDLATYHKKKATGHDI